MGAWALAGLGFCAGIIIFLLMFRYAPAGTSGIRWIFISTGLGTAFLACPGAVWLLLRGMD